MQRKSESLLQSGIMSDLRLQLLSILLLGSALTAGAVEAVLTDDCSFSTKTNTARKWDSPTLLLSETDTVFLRFDVESVLPSGTTADQIAKATVRIWASNVKARGFCAVHPVAFDFREYLPFFFNLSSPPPLGPAQTVAYGGRAKTFLILDVTDMVRSWLSGTPNLGLALRGAKHSVPDGFGWGILWPAFEAQIDSKENTASSHLPTLQIVLRPGTP